VESHHMSVEVRDVNGEPHQSVSQRHRQVHVQVISPPLKCTVSAGREWEERDELRLVSSLTGSCTLWTTALTKFVITITQGRSRV
jgi:hypothetical protein